MTRSLMLAALLFGCSRDAPPAVPVAPAAPTITNRVAVPAAVRQNLGITFAKAESRPVTSTLRIAGHFMVPPSGRAPTHAPSAGLVSVRVEPLDRVEKGQVLASVAEVDLLAERAGIVTEVAVSSGAWVEAGARLLEVVDPASVWLSARVLHSDLTRLKDGQAVNVLPANPNTAAPTKPVAGTLRLGLGDASSQTVQAFVKLAGPAPAWARSGTPALGEIILGDAGTPEVAIPAGALVRDGLQEIFFRRDPTDPNQVIRTEADRGDTDGRWVAVFNDVAVGDEIVVDGAYELKLASSVKPGLVGHFHADGTFHEGSH